MRKSRGRSMVLSDDEVRLVRLFRLLDRRQSDVLADVGREAMKQYSVDPDILKLPGPKDELANELKADGSGYSAGERLMRCMRPLLY